MCLKQKCLRGSFVYPTNKCLHPESDGKSCKVATCNEINCWPRGGAKCSKGQCQKGLNFTDDCVGKSDGDPCFGPTCKSSHSKPPASFKCVMGKCLPPSMVPEEHQCKHRPDGWKCYMNCKEEDCKAVMFKPKQPIKGNMN